MHFRRTIVVWAALVILAGNLFTSPSSASDAGVSLANFSESRGCDPGIAGPQRPHVASSGTMSVNDQIRGPWADMFGRTYYQVRDSLEWWRIPGTSKSIRVHERVLPALEQAATNLNSYVLDGAYYNVYSATAWVWRTVGGRTQISEHALGTAFDINPQSNPYSADNYLRTNLPDWFVSSFTDAGFCWGGDWVDVKDAMHFSWSGPGATPNYPGRPVPYPPVTSATNYRGSVISFVASLSAIAGTNVVASDVTGDGAPDVVQLSPSGRIEAAGAVGDYGVVALRDYTGTGSEDATLGDYDQDGRPDVWVPDRTAGTIRFDVWTSESDYEEAVSITSAAPSGSTRFMLGYYDDDFLPDVYVEDQGEFKVYGSVGEYASVTAVIAMPLGVDAAWHFATGDYDVDGRSDIFAISNGSSPTMRVRTAAGTNISMAPSVEVTAGSAVDFADYDGDGREDLFVLTGSSLEIAFGGDSYGPPDAWFQKANSQPHDAGPECLGSSCDTIGYVNYQGIWSLADRPRTKPATNDFYFGNPGDAPFSGDWNCDGEDTPGLYRRSDGFVYLRASNTQGIADYEFYFGNPGDVPIVGDFNGDGCDTVSIFRPAEHRMYIINELGEDGAGLGAADFSFAFGDVGDVPFVGDFDGDGADEIALHRPSTGRIYLKWELSAGAADTSFVYGLPGDVPVAGDWNGDGVDTVAVFRPDDGNWYIKLTNGAGVADNVVHFHAHDGGSAPVVGKFGS
jgi:hypothetical protein